MCEEEFRAVQTLIKEAFPGWKTWTTSTHPYYYASRPSEVDTDALEGALAGLVTQELFSEFDLKAWIESLVGIATTPPA